MGLWKTGNTMAKKIDWFIDLHGISTKRLYHNDVRLKRKMTERQKVNKTLYRNLKTEQHKTLQILWEIFGAPEWEADSTSLVEHFVLNLTDSNTPCSTLPSDSHWWFYFCLIPIDHRNLSVALIPVKNNKTSTIIS